MCGGSTYNDGKYKNRNAANAAADLFAAFGWSGTKEGYDFWAAVRRRLLQIAEDDQRDDIEEVTVKPVKSVFDILGR